MNKEEKMMNGLVRLRAKTYRYLKESNDVNKKVQKSVSLKET